MAEIREVLYIEVEVERPDYSSRTLLRTGRADFPHPAPDSAKLFSIR